MISKLFFLFLLRNIKTKLKLQNAKPIEKKRQLLTFKKREKEKEEEKARNKIERCVASVLAGSATVWCIWLCSLVFCIFLQQLYPDNGILNSIVAGALTGIIETLLLFPIENVKIQQQITKKKIGNSFWQMWARTWRSQGFFGYYRGMSAILLCSVPNQALRWLAFDTICNFAGCSQLTGASHHHHSHYHLQNSDHHLPGSSTSSPPEDHLHQHGTESNSSLLAVAFAGLGSGLVVALVLGVPVETAKTQSIHQSMIQHPGHAIVGGSKQQEEQQEGGGGEELLYDSDMDALEGTSLAANLPESPASPPTTSPSTTTTSPASSSSPSAAIVVNIPTSSFSLDENQKRVKMISAVPIEPKTVLKGYVPTVLKKVLNQGVRFPVHRMALNLLCSGSSMYETCDASQNPLLGFFAGAIAGISSIFITAPIDMVKSRMQGMDSERYGNSIECALLLLKEEGPTVFLRGTGARALRSGLGAGLAFALFPVIKTFLAAG